MQKKKANIAKKRSSKKIKSSDFVVLLKESNFSSPVDVYSAYPTSPTAGCSTCTGGFAFGTFVGSACC